MLQRAVSSLDDAKTKLQDKLQMHDMPICKTIALHLWEHDPLCLVIQRPFREQLMGQLLGKCIVRVIIRLGQREMVDKGLVALLMKHEVSECHLQGATRASGRHGLRGAIKTSIGANRWTGASADRIFGRSLQ